MKTARQIAKRNRVGLFLTIMGISILSGIVAAHYCYGYSKNGVPAWIVLVIIAISVSGEILFLNNNVRLIRQWRKITERPIEQFPLTDVERESLKGWAEEVLKTHSQLATISFSDRDRIKKELEEFKLNPRPCAMLQLENPNQLDQERERLRKEQEKYDKAHYEIVSLSDQFTLNAEAASRAYHALWDLFSSLKIGDDGNMLPINKETKKVWEDPNEFRLYVDEESMAQLH